MSARGYILASRGRIAALFLGLALAQTLFVVSLLSANPANPISLLPPLLLGAPLLVAFIVASPSAAVLLVPALFLIPVWVATFTPSEIVLLGALLAAVLRHVVSGRRAEAPRAVEVVFALYVLWAGMSVFQAVDLDSALTGFKIIGMLFLAFLAGMRIVGPARPSDHIRVVSLLGVLIAIQLVAVVLGRGFTLAVLKIRVGSMTDLGWGFSVYVAAVAALTSAASIALVFHGRSWERLLGVAGLGAAVFVSILTLSRGGTLAVAVGLLAATAIEARRRLVPAVLIIGALASAYAFSSLGQATLDRFIRPTALPSVAARLIFWQETLHIAREHLLFGVGPNQIPYNTSIYIGPNPHNFLLKNASDLGLPGLFLYLTLLVLVAARIPRLRRMKGRRGRLFALCLILLLLMGPTNALYEPTLEGWVYGGIFWMTAGVLYRASEDPDPGEAAPA